MERKLRLDKILLERGFFESRSKAQEAIKRGYIIVNGKKVNKSGIYVSDDAHIIVIQDLPFVSRGGEKLKEIIERFNIDINEKVCIDIGSSTGGFTQVLLKYGAKRVYAVDIGEGLLHESLRKDNRVIVKEGVNARYLNESDIPEKVDLISQDISFISSKIIISNCKKLLKDGGEYIVLIKPQFEVGKGKINRGVIKNFDIHREVLIEFLEFIKKEEFSPVGLIPSPIKGGDGNIEYLLYMIKIKPPFDFKVDSLVNKSIEEAKERFYENRNNL
ncbi:MAG: TlyA family RNA methyltransferase [Caldisericia bacterium]|nr:TlyA family RNA methyltransferase [Caldisericia bacterium]